MIRPLVIIESPYQGGTEENVRYAIACMVDSIKRGEAPFASHLLYTHKGLLDDTDPEERRLGMTLGWDWMEKASYVAVYTDRGFTDGMKAGIERAHVAGKPVYFRNIVCPNPV